MHALHDAHFFRKQCDNQLFPSLKSVFSGQPFKNNGRFWTPQNKHSGIIGDRSIEEHSINKMPISF
jgi:hypothetical protein